MLLITGNMFVKENRWQTIFLDLRHVRLRPTGFSPARTVESVEHSNCFSFRIGCAQVRALGQLCHHGIVASVSIMVQRSKADIASVVHVGQSLATATKVGLRK